jgi:hypothetical protein
VIAFLALLALPGPYQISPAELPWAVVDRPYSQWLTVRGGVDCSDNNLHVRVEGELPAGLELTGTGQFTGTPTASGTYRLRIHAESICGRSSRTVTLVVTGAPLLRIQTDVVELRYRRGSAPPAAQIQIWSTWPGLEYSIEKSAAAWLRAVPRSGHTPRPGSALECDLVEVRAEATDLSPGVYEASLRFSAWQGVNAPVVRVRLRVE